MIRIMIVDDSRLVYEGLKAMLAIDEEINIIGFAQDGKEAISQIADKKPNIVLVDVLMPVMGGIETTKAISKLFPEVKVIVLSSFEDEPMILDAIAAGAKGYLLKDMIVQDLVSAIRAIDRGFANFAPKVIDSLSKKALVALKPADTPPASLPPAKVSKIKKAKTKLQKPLFQYGDWVSVILAAIILYQTIGMNFYVAHAGLFFLMLSLIARPISAWWGWLLKHRRVIGVSAFALSAVHAVHMFDHSLNWNLDAIAFMLPQHRFGTSAGIISLFLLLPVAITSFQFFQRKLGNKWRQIHLLSVPALIFAILHTVLIGSHYMATFELETINYVRTWGILMVGLLVLLVRTKIFWSIFKLNSVDIEVRKAILK